LALAAWPVMLVLLGRGKRLASIVLVLATLAVLLCLRSRSAMLCLLLAMAVWPVARMLPRASATLIGAGLIGLVAIFPALPLTVDAVVTIHEAAPRLDNSAIHRFLIWHFAIDRIADRPLLGWGLDASRALPGGSERVQEPRLPELAPGTLWMPLHPHNAILQCRLELGLPGAVLGSLVVLYLLWHVSAPETGPPAVRATSLAVIVGSVVVAMLSYGLWQAWWQSSLWLIGALMVAIAPAMRPEPSMRA
jgi:O-antigen ligase